MPKVITVSGSARAGKDTLADMMIDRHPNTFCKMSFATPLKKMEMMLRESYGRFFNVEMSDEQKAHKNGEGLQLLGTEIGRSIIDDAWSRMFAKEIESVKHPYVLVADARFHNEVYSNHYDVAHRFLMYADNSTIRRRLKAVNDNRKLWNHESEKFARSMYDKIEKFRCFSKKSTKKDGFYVINTSSAFGLSLEKMKILVGYFADEIAEHGEIRE